MSAIRVNQKSSPLSIGFPRFKVAYFEAGAEKETVVPGVEASFLRIPAGEGGAWPLPPEPEAFPPPPPPPPPPPSRDENTGLGGWQTVSQEFVVDLCIYT